MNDGDREILAFAAAHRVVLASHVHILLGSGEHGTPTRLAALERAGLVRHERALRSEPWCYQITRQGLAAIGSDLPPPRADLRSCRKDIGVAWLWLAARDGAFGHADRVMSKREQRALDRTRTARAQADERTEPRLPPGNRSEPPFGVRLESRGPELPRLHYPDLLVISEGKRIAIELALSVPGQRSVEQILGGYRAEPSIGVALYLVDDDLVAGSIQAPAARLGISNRIHVQPVRYPGTREQSHATRREQTEPVESHTT